MFCSSWGLFQLGGCLSGLPVAGVTHASTEVSKTLCLFYFAPKPKLNLLQYCLHRYCTDIVSVASLPMCIKCLFVVQILAPRRSKYQNKRSMQGLPTCKAKQSKAACPTHMHAFTVCMHACMHAVTRNQCRSQSTLRRRSHSCSQP
jgi:hypothetical protein